MTSITHSGEGVASTITDGRAFLNGFFDERVNSGVAFFGRWSRDNFSMTIFRD